MAVAAQPADQQRILASLDLPHIDRVARHTADRLQHGAAAVAVLVPGDATRYEITLTRVDDTTIARDIHNGLSGTGSAGWHWVNVALANDGTVYRWDLRSQPHLDYVRTHFMAGALNARQAGWRDWSAVVLTEFLRRVSHHWNHRDVV